MTIEKPSFKNRIYKTKQNHKQVFFLPGSSFLAVNFLIWTGLCAFFKNLFAPHILKIIANLTILANIANIANIARITSIAKVAKSFIASVRFDDEINTFYLLTLFESL